MKEKIQGLVYNQSELLVSDIKLAGYGLTKDSRLVDVINIVNNTESNNVIRLSIVNEHGADVTASSKEAQSLCLGVMFPGLYTIGRDKNAEGVKAKKTEIDYVLSSKRRPHSNYQEAIWKELKINTDVDSHYPIFAKANNDLSAQLPVATDINGNWLKPVGVIDKIAIKNKKDYEEVELNEFDLYKRLGSGFAQTAHIVELKNSHGATRGYKVTIPESNDPNRVVGIMDGIYSMLENHSTNYTVLTSVNAESKIDGKLPRKDAFRKRKAGTFNLQDTETPVIELVAKIDPKDFSEARTCNVEIANIKTGIKQDEILSNLDTEIKAVRVEQVEKAHESDPTTLPEDSIVVVVDTSTYELKKVAKGQLTPCTESGIFIINKENKLVLVESNEGTVTDKVLEKDKTFLGTHGDVVNVYKAKGENSELEPICVLSQIANSELDEDYTICYVEDMASGLNIKVFSTEAQWMTYSELVDKLNEEDGVFSTYFKAGALTPDAEVGTSAKGTGKDKGDAYFDTTMYIPYTTTDNFARHLAQHCTYTSLKTYPTHGIIGCAKLNGVNLATVADRVNEILDLDLDLYAKNSSGNNMLNNNNIPYPIGMRVSIPFMQYSVTTGNGYNYVSNGASGYAGMVSALPAERSSTNQPISLPGLAFELSNYQLSKLTGKGIVTVKNTTAGTVITDGITMAPIDSAYRRLSTAKVINIVSAVLSDAIQPYIGLQDNLMNRNSMTTAITSRLNKLKESLISYYKFDIVTDPSSAKMGIIKVQYVIIPYNEIKEVRNTVSVQESN